MGQKSNVLADGGGIRGYPALLILKWLMEAISHREASVSNGEAKSSYHPLLPPPTTSECPPPTASELSSGRMATGEGEGSTSAWLPYHYFDYMAGTSTGGYVKQFLEMKILAEFCQSLIAIMLGRLRMSVDDGISVYEQLGERIFGRPRWFHVRSPLFWPRDEYNHKTLETIIQDLVQRGIPNHAPGGRNLAFDENRCRVWVSRARFEIVC